MADTRTKWRTERRGERADSGWLDDRGVSEVIGSILVFGLLVSLLAIVQTQAVPDANNEVEFQHNQEVQRDLSKLSAAISRSSITGSGEVASVATGTTYPQRLVLYNPPAPTGALRTSEPRNIYVFNVSGTDRETQDYIINTLGTNFSGQINESFSLTTSRLTYEPDYNLYQNAPTTAMEYGVLYNQREESTTIESTGSIVDGKQINLRLLGDGLSSSGQLTRTVRTETLSTGGGASVRGINDIQAPNRNNLTLRLPTRINESEWTGTLLAGEIDDPGGANDDALEPGDHCQIQVLTESGYQTVAESSFGNATADNDRYVRDCRYRYTGGTNYIRLEFEPDTQYDLRMSKIGFESGSPADPGPKYVTVDERSVSLSPTGQTEVSATVRDRYNNPVSGVELIANITSGRAGAALSNTTTGGVNNVTLTTDEDGVATATLTSGTQFSGSEVQFKGDFDGDGVRGTLNPIVSSNSDPRSPENASVFVSPAGTSPVRLTDAAITEANAVNLTLKNEGLSRNIKRVKLNYVSVHHTRSVVEDANLIFSLINTVLLPGDAISDSEVQAAKSDVTNVTDGPDQIDGIALSGPGIEGVRGALDSPAVENEGGSPLSTPAIPQDGTAELQLIFDQTFGEEMDRDFGENEQDAVAMSVVVTYQDGTRETYITMLRAGDDDER